MGTFVVNDGGRARMGDCDIGEDGFAVDGTVKDEVRAETRAILVEAADLHFHS